MRETVVVLGASGHKSRYANRAIKLLMEKGHTVVPVNPLYESVEDLHCYKSLSEINGKIDTITLYVNPDRALDYSSEIISVKPDRVIINPGAENTKLDMRLKEAGITVIHDCTLVMLNTGKF